MLLFGERKLTATISGFFFLRHLRPTLSVEWGKCETRENGWEMCDYFNVETSTHCRSLSKDPNCNWITLHVVDAVDEYDVVERCRMWKYKIKTGNVVAHWRGRWCCVINVENSTSYEVSLECYTCDVSSSRTTLACCEKNFSIRSNINVVDWKVQQQSRHAIAKKKQRKSLMKFIQYWQTSSTTSFSATGIRKCATEWETTDNMKIIRENKYFQTRAEAVAETFKT